MTKGSKPVVSLRKSLRIRLAVLVACAVLLVGMGGFFFGIEPMAARIAENQFALAAAQVETSLDAIFRPAEQILKMSRTWIGEEPPDLDSPNAFNRQFRPVLEELSQATSIVAGTSDGEGWMLLHQSDGSWLNRLTDRKRWGDRHLFFDWGVAGKEQHYWKSLDYDPRQRSWYTTALSDTKNVQWTAPYTFFTTGDPGITASTSTTLKDGRSFVIGIDLMLRDLSSTTMNAPVGQHGMALVLTEDLKVMALPASPVGIDRTSWLGKVLKSSIDLSLVPLNDALSHWRSSGSAGVISYRSGGKIWLAHIHPYSLGKLHLWVVTLAPETDFSPDWVTAVGFLAAGLAFMLLLATFIAQQQAKRIAQPLEALLTAS